MIHKPSILLIVLMLPMAALALTPSTTPYYDAEHMKDLDRVVQAAIDLEITPGAVVVAGRGSGIVFQKAWGRTMYDPKSPAVTVDTVYDLASVSKSIGTATSVMILADRNKISLKDPVSKYLPAMQTDDKKDITIEQCLLHRGGFLADNDIKDYKDGRERALEKLFATKLKYEPGKDYVYSDVSFIVLGELVKAVSGKPLNEFAAENIFQPLGTKSMTYLPPAEWRDHIAPTEKRDGKWIIGEVHDPRAYALGGFAGHAGLFSNGADVGRWCQMMLNMGQLDGKQIVGKSAIEAMTKPHSLTNAKGEKFVRAMGLDIDTAHTGGPRGRVFEKGKTYGHTGYTGTSFWIDPVNNVFVVLLTNRVHPDDDIDVKALRKRVSTIVAESFIRN